MCFLCGKNSILREISALKGLIKGGIAGVSSAVAPPSVSLVISIPDDGDIHTGTETSVFHSQQALPMSALLFVMDEK